MRNWAGNHEYRAKRIHRPETIEAVQELVRRTPRLRVLGTRHSFNDIADTPGDLVSLERIPKELSVDPASGLVRVGAGVRYGDVCEPVDRAGRALHNLASLPHISVAGAIATATHGSGAESANLATAVTAMEVIAGDGERIRFSRMDASADLDGAAVALGGLGVVTEVVLETEPSYLVRQDVYEGLDFARLDDRFDEVASMADSVCFFTTWREPTFEQVWFKRRIADDGYEAEPERLGARRATEPRHPIEGFPPEVCTEQLGVPGPWHARLPHFRMEHTPSAGAELQSEYLVPRRHAAAAIRAISGIRERIASLVQVSELRTIAADDLWMSPCFATPTVSVHFTWRPDWPAVKAVLPIVEAALAPFEPRPHWAKLSTMAPDEVRSRYPRLDAFQALLERHDPEGRFRNAFLDRYVFA